VAFAWGLRPELSEAVLDLTEGAIREAVYWLGRRVGGHEGQELAGWADEEIPSLRGLLWCSLAAGGCRCWERWEALSIQSQAHAVAHCAAHHDLARWDCDEPLRDFLFRAFVSGALQLPDEGVPELAYANDFRRGMLAKAVTIDGVALMAGPVLICHVAGCSGEVNLHDHCGACAQLALVNEPSWRLWPEGRRAPAHCRRCVPSHGGCDCLYFNHAGPCPNCHEEAWSPRRTRVWLPVGVAGPAAHDPTDPGLPPDEIAAAREALERWLGGVSDARQRAILRGLLFGERMPAELAADMGAPLGGRAFEDLMRQALRLLTAELSPAACDAGREEARP
jgi:hypothetical protein